jgi:uncharacterized membrane protein
MNIKRIARHLAMTDWQVHRAFPRHTLIAIEQEIKASESAHNGEICFVVEGALDGAPLFKGQSARERAIDVFSQLRIWDTEHNNGVLIYLLLADHDVEIVADRGINLKVGSLEWQNLCHKMEAAFKQADYEAGLVSGIQGVTRTLIQNFPTAGAGRNELPNQPLIV